MTQNSLKFCLLVVLYNPSSEDLDRLKIYSNCGYFQHITVWDNSNTTNVKYIPLNIEYIFHAQNEGLSVPYNYMIDWCANHRYDYLCLMDQDSNYPLVEMKKLIDRILLHRNSFTNTAVIAPRVYSAPAQPRRSRSDSLTHSRTMLNSGCFLNIACLKKYELRYDENIFLYYVDLDFCMSILEKKCQILIYENSVYEQNVGDPLKRTNKIRGYRDPYKYYLIVHYQRYTLCKHRGIFIGNLWALARGVNLIRKIALYEEDRLSKIHAVLRGMFD